MKRKMPKLSTESREVLDIDAISADQLRAVVKAILDKMGVAAVAYSTPDYQYVELE